MKRRSGSQTASRPIFCSEATQPAHEWVCGGAVSATGKPLGNGCSGESITAIGNLVGHTQVQNLAPFLMLASVDTT